MYFGGFGLDAKGSLILQQLNTTFALTRLWIIITNRSSSHHVLGWTKKED